MTGDEALRHQIEEARKKISEIDIGLAELRQRHHNLHSDKNRLSDDVDSLKESINGNGHAGIKTRVITLENATKTLVENANRSMGTTRTMFGWMLVIQLAILSGLIAVAVRG